MKRIGHRDGSNRLRGNDQPHNAGQAEEVWPRIVRTLISNIGRVDRGEPPLILAKPLD